MHPDAPVLKCNDLVPAAVGELLEAELVPVVVGLGHYVGVKLQGRVSAEETTKTAVEVVEVGVGLTLFHRRLEAVGDIS